MPQPSSVDPETLGIEPKRLTQAFALVETWTSQGILPAAGVCLGRSSGVIAPRWFGRKGLERTDPPLGPEALFLVASITKPMTATAVMILVERGEISLDDPVVEFVPEFAENGKQEVRLRHLLTHTSGLPDMLPNNTALRAAHAPLSRFVEEICRCPLMFPPGTQVRYQSTGFAMLGEVVQRVAGRPLADVLRIEVFEPLDMADTSLGVGPNVAPRVCRIRLGAGQERGSDWDWNSPYWLGLGAPWGGLITSPADLSRFCRVMLGAGRLDGVRLLGPATVRAMVRNQLDPMPNLPESDRRCRPWGFGWRLHWPGSSAHFGDLIGPGAFGHWGATGTLCWIDPDADAFLVLLTTEPAGERGRWLARLSNAFAAAIL